MSDYKWQCQKTATDKGEYYIRGLEAIEIVKDYKNTSAVERITRINLQTQIVGFMEKHGIIKIEIDKL